jgi:hypothetical protein
MGGSAPRLGGGDLASKPLTPDEQEQRRMLSKLHPSLIALINRLKKGSSTPTPDEAKFVRNGKAEIQLFLADKSPETMAQLKGLGFEILLEPKTGKILMGRLPIEKLSALADLKAIRYISPMS